MNVHHKKIIELRNNGKSYQEVADAIGITKDYAKKLCKLYGVAYSFEEVKQRGGAPLTVNEWQARIKEKTDGRFTFVALDQRARGEKQFTVKCNNCGTVKTITSITLRHYGCHCEVCAEKDRQAKCRTKQQLKELEAKTLRFKKERAKVKKRLEQKQIAFNFCACGALLPYNRVVCDSCKHDKLREKYRRKNIRRRGQTQGAEQDKDITLKKVYDKDNGICYLCGVVCNWNDYKIVNNAFIVGKTYPTIEHVKPLSKGGNHKWGNVRLACHFCNSKKSDRVAG